MDRSPQDTALPNGAPRPAVADSVFVGDGDLAQRCRDFDWAQTSLGAVETWSQSLCTTVSTLLMSRHPMFLWWGADLVQIYNDGYRPSLGGDGRHPRALGARGREFWTEIWDAIGPQIDSVMAGEGSTWHEDQYLPIDRNGRREDVWWTYSYSPVRDDDGRIGGTLVVCQETTQRILGEQKMELLLKTVEQLLAESQRARADAEMARTEAEAANRAKSEFLAVMSHELRTPLNAIGGYAELLDMGIRGPVTAMQHADLARIQTSQRHLLGLINEVLNYAKLETGTVRYDVTDVSVRNALLAAEELVAPQVRSRGISLTVGDCPFDVLVRADGEKVRQILVNLLSNAIKFTDAGGRIDLLCDGSATPSDTGDDAPPTVAISVRDTGIGIPAEKVEMIFEPFVQVRSDLTRTAEGTGLGLAISRELASAMGGTLTVESEPGAGSTFTLRLPSSSQR